MSRLLFLVSVLSAATIAGCNEPDVISILCACSRINFAGMNEDGTMYEIEAEINLGNVKCKTTAERLKWKPMASIYVGNSTTILGSGAIKCSIRQPFCKKKLSFPNISQDEDLIVWIRTIIDDFVFCRPVALPTPASLIENNRKNPHITTQHAHRTFTPSPTKPTLVYIVSSVSVPTLAVCAVAVGFLCRRKRQQSRASRSSIHEPSSRRLIELSLEPSHTHDTASRDLLVIALPESGSSRISSLINEIQTRRIAVLFKPENSEEDVFKNMDQWIDDSIKTCMHQQMLVILTVNLVSQEVDLCSGPFDDVSRTFFRRMMSYLSNVGSEKMHEIFYVFLDPPDEILDHFPPQALVLSPQQTYNFSQDENRHSEMNRLLNDLQ